MHWAMIYEACQSLRSLVAADDSSKDFSGSFDHAKTFFKKGAVKAVMHAASLLPLSNVPPVTCAREIKVPAPSACLASVLMAARQLATSEEVVNSIMDQGGMEMLTRALESCIEEVTAEGIVEEAADMFLNSGAVAMPTIDEGTAEEKGREEEDRCCRGGSDGKATKDEGQRGTSTAQLQLARATLALARNVCNSDRHRIALCNSEVLSLILQTMKAHLAVPYIQECGAGCLGAMALRQPKCTVRMIQHGAHQAICNALRKHPEHVALQRQCCLCLRNMAVRTGEDVREAILSCGAETLLRAAGKHQGSVDEAYAALRDLGCDVALVKYNEDGKVAEDKAQSKFNPVHETSNRLEQKLLSASQAPAASMKL
uniref:Armadillo repeat-containing protein 6 n=1 Tax=Fibrocapsa japonica TaxID=94617 RepID=A0A7S2V0I0_9STRA